MHALVAAIGERRRARVRLEALAAGCAMAGDVKALDKMLGAPAEDEHEAEPVLYAPGEEDEWADEMRAAWGSRGEPDSV